MMRKRNRVRILLFLAGAAGVLIGAPGCMGVLGSACPAKVKELQRAASTELVVGMADDAVRPFMTRHHIDFIFDKHMNRYQGIIRDVSSNCDIVVLVYMDGRMNYLGSEFFDTYTGL